MLIDWFQSSKDKEKSTSKNKQITAYVVILVLIGMLFMLFGGNPLQSSSEKGVPVAKISEEEKEASPTFGQSSSSEPFSMSEYEKVYEDQLREVLEEVIGIEDVTVMVNLDASEMKVYEKNIVHQTQKTNETDREGGKRQVEDLSRDEQLVILRNGEEESPIIVKKVKPSVRGVLIVARGADNVKVKQWIIEAVTKVLDVPNHRISVLPKKIEGE